MAEKKTKSIDKLKKNKVSGKKVQGGGTTGTITCPPGYTYDSVTNRCVAVAAR